MTDKDRLVQLLDSKELHRDGVSIEDVAEYLLKNGVCVNSCNVGDIVFGIYIHFEYINRKGEKKINEFIPPSEKYIRDNIQRLDFVVKQKKYVKSDEYKIGKYLFLDEEKAKEKIIEIKNRAVS